MIQMTSLKNGLASQRGFNLIELMITIFIVAILLVVGVPSFQQMIQSNRLAGVTNGVIGALNFARSEAIKRGAVVHVGSVSHGVNAAEPSVDWVAWVDSDGNNDWDAGEEIRVWDAIDPTISVSLTTAAAYFEFNSQGTINSANSIQLCDSRTGERGSQIDLLVSGVIVTKKITCS